MENNRNVQYQTNCTNQCRDITLKSSFFFSKKVIQKVFWLFHQLLPQIYQELDLCSFRGAILNFLLSAEESIWTGLSVRASVRLCVQKNV